LTVIFICRSHSFFSPFTIRRLIDEVKQQLLLHRRGNVFLRACKRYFQSWHTYALLLCLSLLVASFVLLILDAYLSSRIIIEMAVLVLAFITNFLWVYFRTRRDLLARTVRIEAHLQYFASNSDPLLEQDFHNLFTRSSIESTITVRRNGEWIKVPMNLVAAGDTVGFLPLDKPALRVRCIDPRLRNTHLFGTEFHAGESVPRSTLRQIEHLELIAFEAMEFPIVPQIQLGLQPKRRNESQLEIYIRLVSIISFVVLVISEAIALLTNALR
jgi:hypothetical protein